MDIVERLRVTQQVDTGTGYYKTVCDPLRVEAATLIEQLRAENAELRKLLNLYRTHLWWLVGGGEFSAWFVESDVSLPMGAMKEWDEARDFAENAMKEGK